MSQFNTLIISLSDVVLSIPLRPIKQESIMAAVVSPVDFLGACDSSIGGKPYSLRYEPPEGFPRSNFASEAHDQSIEDVRGREKELSIQKQGFALLTIEPHMSYEDFDNKDKVESIYFKQVAEGLRTLLDASRVQIFEHVVSTFDSLLGHQYTNYP